MVVSISILISIFSKFPYRYFYGYRYFQEWPYRYRYFSNCPYQYRYFPNFLINIFIDIDIFQIFLSIFFRYRYSQNKCRYFIDISKKADISTICSTSQTRTCSPVSAKVKRKRQMFIWKLCPFLMGQNGEIKENCTICVLI